MKIIFTIFFVSRQALNYYYMSRNIKIQDYEKK
jgi:hypothetical protein